MANAPTSKENNSGKNIFAIIVTILFIGAMIARYTSKDYDIPFALEVAFMTVTGWVFGSTFTNVLKEFINKGNKKGDR